MGGQAGSQDALMKNRFCRTVIALTLAAVIAETAYAGLRGDSCHTATILLNLNRVRAMDWRNATPQVAEEWRATRVHGDSDNIYSHIAAKQDGVCICCESLVFQKDERGEHLIAVDISRFSRSRAGAIVMANELVRSALPSDDAFSPITVDERTPLLRSCGHPSPNPDVILDARVFQRGDVWQVNLYWSRVYVAQ